MAEGLRSRFGNEPTKDDEKLNSLKLALSSMLTSALKEQQTRERQFAKFEDQLATIKSEVRTQRTQTR